MPDDKQKIQDDLGKVDKDSKATGTPGGDDQSKNPRRDKFADLYDSDRSSGSSKSTTDTSVDPSEKTTN